MADQMDQMTKKFAGLLKDDKVEARNNGGIVLRNSMQGKVITI